MKAVASFDPIYDGISDLVDAAIASPERVDQIKAEIHVLLARRARLAPAPEPDDDPIDELWENVPL
jgi:hypothetical protein